MKYFVFLSIYCFKEIISQEIDRDDIIPHIHPLNTVVLEKFGVIIEKTAPRKIVTDVTETVNYSLKVKSPGAVLMEIANNGQELQCLKGYSNYKTKTLESSEKQDLFKRLESKITAMWRKTLFTVIGDYSDFNFNSNQDMNFLFSAHRDFTGRGKRFLSELVSVGLGYLIGLFHHSHYNDNFSNNDISISKGSSIIQRNTVDTNKNFEMAEDIFCQLERGSQTRYLEKFMEARVQHASDFIIKSVNDQVPTDASVINDLITTCVRLQSFPNTSNIIRQKIGRSCHHWALQDKKHQIFNGVEVSKNLDIYLKFKLEIPIFPASFESTFGFSVKNLGFFDNEGLKKKLKLPEMGLVVQGNLTDFVFGTDMCPSFICSSSNLVQSNCLRDIMALSSTKNCEIIEDKDLCSITTIDRQFLLSINGYVTGENGRPKKLIGNQIIKAGTVHCQQPETQYILKPIKTNKRVVEVLTEYKDFEVKNFLNNTNKFTPLNTNITMSESKKSGFDSLLWPLTLVNLGFTLFFSGIIPAMYVLAKEKFASINILEPTAPRGSITFPSPTLSRRANSIV